MIEVMKQAIQTLEGWDNYGDWVWSETALAQCKRNTKESLTALRQAIEQAEKVENPPIRIQNHTHIDQAKKQAALDKMADNARELGLSYEPVAKYDSIELHVLHSHFAGMLFDFMGWLTSRSKRICLSEKDNASPAVDAIVDFAKMRGLNLEDAQVKTWQAILTEPAQQTHTDHPMRHWDRTCPACIADAEKQEPVAWRHWIKVDGEMFPQLTLIPRTDKDDPLYAAPLRKEWQGLTDDEVVDAYCQIADCTEWAIGGLTHATPFARDIEAKLKELNHEL